LSVEEEDRRSPGRHRDHGDQQQRTSPMPPSSNDGREDPPRDRWSRTVADHLEHMTLGVPQDGSTLGAWNSSAWPGSAKTAGISPGAPRATPTAILFSEVMLQQKQGVSSAPVVPAGNPAFRL
jgi:hypothetical protein